MNKYLSKLNNIPFSGAIGRPASAGAVIGAVGGMGVGAYRADEGSRLSGALKGGAVGGLLGAGAGAASSLPKVKKLIDARTARRAERAEHYATIDSSIKSLIPRAESYAVFNKIIKLPEPEYSIANKALQSDTSSVVYGHPLLHLPSRMFSDRGLVRLRHKVKEYGVKLDPKKQGGYISDTSQQILDKMKPIANEKVERAISDYYNNHTA